MTTTDILNWSTAAYALYSKLKDTEKAITIHSALMRTKLIGEPPSESDLEFAMAKLTAMSIANAKKVKLNAHDPLFAACAQMNADALSAVLQETGVQLNAATYRQWRPTVRNIGVISGVSTTKATILATDGNLGLFVDERGAFMGHIQHFDGEVKTLFSVNRFGQIASEDGADKPKRKPRVKRIPEYERKAQKLLEDLDIT